MESRDEVSSAQDDAPKHQITSMTQHHHYKITLRPEPDGGFTAIVPALPGCVTYGRTLKEARRMVKDAIDCYIASLKKHGEPIPNRP
jgi:antitoxin HicB